MLFFLPSFNYLELTFCFYLPCFLYYFFQIFLENRSLFARLRTRVSVHLNVDVLIYACGKRVSVSATLGKAVKCSFFIFFFFHKLDHKSPPPPYFYHPGSYFFAQNSIFSKKLCLKYQKLARMFFRNILLILVSNWENEVSWILF